MVSDDKSGTIKITYKAITDIRPYPNNPRHNAPGVNAVAASIKEFGFKVPIIIDSEGEIVAGHTRILAAEQLGLKKVPCIIADDLTEAQIKAFRIADNQTASLTEWNEELLSVELGDLADMNFDLSITGFSDIELEGFFNVGRGGVTEDQPPDPPEEPTTKPGDLWLLGSHRLLCGDATIPADVDRLMAGKQADMVFTDPPYNVDYQGCTKEKLKIKNDKMADAAFYQFLHKSFTNMLAATVDGGAIYVCHADTEGINFRMAMTDAGWLQKQCIIWVKNSIVMGRQDYHWKHEPILYGWKPGAAHKWYGGRKTSTVVEDSAQIVFEEKKDHFVIHVSHGIQQVAITVPSYEVDAWVDDGMTTVWRVEKPTRNDVHPTMKPVGLCAKGIGNSCPRGGIVLDPFGGSGSTLIACEQLGRSCYMMELDPKYSDVIVQRWENFTGKKAQLTE